MVAEVGAGIFSTTSWLVPEGTADRLSPEAFANLMIKSKGVSNRLAGPGYEMVRQQLLSAIYVPGAKSRFYS